MKKVLLLSIACILISATLPAQNCIHTWKMGPLTWNDFTHKNAIDGQYSYLEYFMSIEEGAKEIDGVKYLKPSVKAFIDPKYCWCDTLYRTDNMLQYNQCCFDLIEVYRRQLESDITGSIFVDGSQLLDKTMKRLNDDLRRIEVETVWGSDTAALHHWQNSVKHLLDSTASSTTLHYKDAPFRWGFDFDLNFLGVAGNIHDYFSHGGGASWYGEMGIGHNFFGFGMGINGARCRKDALHVDEDRSYNDLFVNDPLCQLDLMVYYGYSVIDNAKHRVTPFVGYGLQGFYFTPDEGSSVGFTTGAWHFGVDYNYIFSNDLMFWGELFDEYNATHDVMTLNTKLFVTYDKFNNIIGSPAGLTINLQVGLSLLGGRAKIF